jgi:predicted DNA-binding protein (MmcQ/YjbR family)
MSLTMPDLLAYCLAKPGAWQDDPWGGDIVAKVGDKVFAFCGSLETGTSVTVKCGANRDEADEWPARFPDDAKASSYIGRFGWNSLSVGGEIPDEDLFEAVDTSYLAVVRKLPKRLRPVGYDKP